MTSAIIVEHLLKRFPGTDRASVDAVSLSIAANECVVLLGPSGCGKTTLLKMINRLYEPTSGTIMLNGVDITRLPVTQVRRQIGYVIQQTGLFPHMRIEDNIAVVPRLLGWDKQRIDRRVDELLELIGLPLSYRRRYPRQLSGGEQQRVGIARALAADPQIMLMDEPFGALDAITRRHLQDELRSIQQRLHKTILFVTHDVDEALRLADRIIVMREGKIVQFDTPLDLLEHPADAFVAQLVAADDLLRRLTLINVATVMAPIDASRQMPREPQISATADLRSALTVLLSSGADQLMVVDGNGSTVGAVSFERVQAITRGSVETPHLPTG